MKEVRSEMRSRRSGNARAGLAHRSGRVSALSQRIRNTKHLTRKGTQSTVAPPQRTLNPEGSPGSKCNKASLPQKNTRIASMLMSFRPLVASLKLTKALRRTSGSLPGPRSETRADPEPSPQRDPSFSYHKTTNLGHQSWHVGDTNKPQPPPPVKLSFESARYTIPCKSPSSPDPQGRRIPRACGHMRRP